MNTTQWPWYSVNRWHHLWHSTSLLEQIQDAWSGIVQLDMLQCPCLWTMLVEWEAPAEQIASGMTKQADSKVAMCALILFDLKISSITTILRISAQKIRFDPRKSLCSGFLHWRLTPSSSSVACAALWVPQASYAVAHHSLKSVAMWSPSRLAWEMGAEVTKELQNSINHKRSIDQAKFKTEYSEMLDFLLRSF